MNGPTPRECDLMTMIGDGSYGCELPDDDEALNDLTRCVEQCWVIWEPSMRSDDYYYLSPHGREVLAHEAKAKGGAS